MSTILIEKLLLGRIYRQNKNKEDLIKMAVLGQNILIKQKYQQS